ncbi:MAG: tRNA (adenosine(37)-N6)-threonylcarbamoyltransferase complex ATPase subunit type 1 TsaE [Dehalococcoidia bacterium]|nr:tRNA (adenosine(37)-N6)-threonylcarbamoyltransferase complex ATPase subunit type 1 TsaE [Dehalococcoidia bacterium]
MLLSDSPAATRRIGRRLARHLRAGDVVLLQGELGAGKTCLAQGIGEGLGVREQVKSSAFVLVNEYEGRLRMYLADLYRLSEPAEVADLALEENAAGGVLVVEWPDRAWEEMPRERLLIRLRWLDDRSRELSLEPEGARARELTEKLVTKSGRRRR